MDPAPLYGFSLGFSFAERWNVSAVFVTGRYISKFSHLAASYPAPVFVTLMEVSWLVTPTAISSRQSTNKYDLDPTLSCAVTSFMKVFIGFKFQHYTVAE
ncbi:MAG TPA: hypothetical protein PLM53_18625 [Spirochaetota bacterium]|nr:hypothetical protein [Spirochaetota bacterium]HPC40652.1 hypothetical protein [Spirochaetota bacterium]HPL18627.1 hypothetical protein [Spirochaetota bacterium]HQF10237.1 hypothetical protein [Spirochaetota bacterium]HQH99115.1 hypothetical protein [Spirochaetota bacterium]